MAVPLTLERVNEGLYRRTAADIAARKQGVQLMHNPLAELAPVRQALARRARLWLPLLPSFLSPRQHQQQAQQQQQQVLPAPSRALSPAGESSGYTDSSGPVDALGVPASSSHVICGRVSAVSVQSGKDSSNFRATPSRSPAADELQTHAVGNWFMRTIRYLLGVRSQHHALPPATSTATSSATVSANPAPSTTPGASSGLSSPAGARAPGGGFQLQTQSSPAPVGLTPRRASIVAGYNATTARPAAAVSGGSMRRSREARESRTAAAAPSSSSDQSRSGLPPRPPSTSRAHCVAAASGSSGSAGASSRRLLPLECKQAPDSDSEPSISRMGVQQTVLLPARASRSVRLPPLRIDGVNSAAAQATTIAGSAGDSLTDPAVGLADESNRTLRLGHDQHDHDDGDDGIIITSPRLATFRAAVRAARFGSAAAAGPAEAAAGMAELNAHSSAEATGKGSDSDRRTCANPLRVLSLTASESAPPSSRLDALGPEAEVGDISAPTRSRAEDAMGAASGHGAHGLRSRVKVVQLTSAARSRGQTASGMTTSDSESEARSAGTAVARSRPLLNASSQSSASASASAHAAAHVGTAISPANASSLSPSATGVALSLTPHMRSPRQQLRLVALTDKLATPLASARSAWRTSGSSAAASAGASATSSAFSFSTRPSAARAHAGEGPASLSADGRSESLALRMGLHIGLEVEIPNGGGSLAAAGADTVAVNVTSTHSASTGGSESSKGGIGGSPQSPELAAPRDSPAVVATPTHVDANHYASGPRPRQPIRQLTLQAGIAAPSPAHATSTAAYRAATPWIAAAAAAELAAAVNMPPALAAAQAQAAALMAASSSGSGSGSSGPGANSSSGPLAQVQQAGPGRTGASPPQAQAPVRRRLRASPQLQLPHRVTGLPSGAGSSAPSIRSLLPTPAMVTALKRARGFDAEDSQGTELVSLQVAGFVVASASGSGTGLSITLPVSAAGSTPSSISTQAQAQVAAGAKRLASASAGPVTGSSSSSGAVDFPVSASAALTPTANLTRPPCAICFELPGDAVFLECGHAGICGACASIIVRGVESEAQEGTVVGGSGQCPMVSHDATV